MEAPLERRIDRHQDSLDRHPRSLVHADFSPKNLLVSAEGLMMVDFETGHVDLIDFAVAEDCGTMVNPMIVEGQIRGGVVQGIGTALHEEIVYDARGQPLAATFLDYQMPRAGDLPDLVVETIVTPSPNNFLGFKGVGELPTNGAPAAVANAVLDALRPLGVRHIDMPLTAHKIWTALEAARKR